MFAFPSEVKRTEFLSDMCHRPWRSGLRPGSASDLSILASDTVAHDAISSAAQTRAGVRDIEDLSV
jgi:hypothetical protein